MTEEEEDRQELDYLRWFCTNADFGPAEGDVRIYMQNEYVSQTGKPVPPEWLENEGD